MKKIISLLLIAVMICGFSICSSAAIKNEADIMDLLSELEIMSGDPDGNLRLNDYVTRAEFSKVAVATSTYKNSVATALKVSPFSDVTYKHWAAPFVQVAVINGICEGYTDATFKPDNLVTFEEAVTMLLRVLGYTDADFGISWPYGQIGMANNLDMTENVNANIGDKLTRGQVATLVFNTLDTKMKNSQSKLISIFDCSLVEDVTLVATKNENSGMASGKIYTTSGLYDLNLDFDYGYVGKKGDLYVKNGDDIICFIPDDQIVEAYTVTDTLGSDLVLDGNILDIDSSLTTYYKSTASNYSSVVASANEGDEFRVYYNNSNVIQYAMLIPKNSGSVNNTQILESYTVYQVLDKAVVAYKGSERVQLDFTDSTVFYDDTLKTSYASLKSKIEMGDKLHLKRKDDNTIDYVSYKKGEVIGPKTVKNSLWLSELTSNTANLKITRDGVSVSSEDIKNYDIVYYIPDLNMVLAYTTKITGIYENATPNKDVPTSITVSGKTYLIESGEAFNKLSSAGQFSYGDTVTLLLGRNNGVADVISPENASFSGEIVGYVTGSGIKEIQKPDTTTYMGYYIKLALPDGNEYEYIANKNYEASLNSIVKLTFTDGVAKASSVNKMSGSYGVFDWKNKKMGKYTLSQNIKIIDVATTEQLKKSAYAYVYPQRIDGLSADNKILYMKKDSNNEVTELIFSNITGDSLTYALVTDVTRASVFDAQTGETSKSNNTSSFRYSINGTDYSYNGATAFSGITNGVPVSILYAANGQIEVAKPLLRVEGLVKEITDTTLKTSSESYVLSDKVMVYKRDYNYDYTLFNISEIDFDKYTVNAYYDKKSENGGRIRVIIAMQK